MSVSVCLSVREHVSENHVQATKCCVLVECGRCSVLLCRHSNKLYTSGFVDDVLFAHNRPRKGDVISDSVGSAALDLGPSLISTIVLFWYKKTL